ncbi:MAG: hypothetical protein KAU01_06320 [Candidatus Cloacimonetes bacterium]|nr:hypothetical protein [Candidatus Cloacimonadota bacterium]
MTLLDESDKFVVLVSPYFKISKWYKLIKKMEQLKSRNIQLNVFVRAGDENINTFKDLNKIDIDFQVIPNLHCKLYLNEKYGIITSMNLLLNSEINSLEIGYITETEQELNELLNFCKRYLKFYIDEDQCTDIDDIIDSINYRLNKEDMYKSIKVWVDDWTLRINTGINNYEVYFSSDDQNDNFLSISGILSGKEFDTLRNKINHLKKKTDLDIEIVKGLDNHYNMILGTSLHSYISIIIHEIISKEADVFVQEIVGFVIAVDRFKIDT